MEEAFPRASDRASPVDENLESTERREGVFVAEDIKNVPKLLGADLIIMYRFSHIHPYAADDGYRFMGPTGSGKSHVRDVSYKSYFSCFHLV